MTERFSLPAFGRILASPSVVFWCLPWLMIILALGTLAQAEIGLYAAHKQYFSSFFIWLGPIPLPGAWPVLALITISLSAKFLFSSPWDVSRLGTTLTHLGVLLLLYGGLATALTQQEHFMVIKEGEQSNTLREYHRRDLMVLRDGEIIWRAPAQDMVLNQPLDIDGLPFTLTPIFHCYNCSAEPVATADETRRGMAEKINLVAVDREKEDELNLSGVMLRVEGDEAIDGLYALLEDVPMTIKSGDFEVKIGRRETTLPFTVQLESFHRDIYPGTNTARGFSSDITVLDGDIRWGERIEMNEPLRYRGYTFYQSSFTQGMDGIEKTVLSVVQNKGRLFPYIASIIILAGLCVHLWQRLSGRRRMT